MYQIITITLEPPDIKVPFLPNHTIDSAPPKGRTFEIDLHAYRTKYSQALTDLIYECLYENPKFRPELHVLKHKITTGYQDALEAGAELEDWQHFIPAPAAPPPPPPLVAARKRKRGGALYPPGDRRYICQGILRTGLQCKNVFRGPGGILNPRCTRCTAMGR